jgi:hypothetical protein
MYTITKNGNKSLAELNIVASCYIQVIDVDAGRWQTVARCPDTPRYIAETAAAHGLERESYWIYRAGDRTLEKTVNGFSRKA